MYFPICRMSMNNKICSRNLHILKQIWTYQVKFTWNGLYCTKICKTHIQVEESFNLIQWKRGTDYAFFHGKLSCLVIWRILGRIWLDIRKHFCEVKQMGLSSFWRAYFSVLYSKPKVVPKFHVVQVDGEMIPA